MLIAEDDESDKPVALPTEKFTAKATREGDEKTYELVSARPGQ